MLLSLKLAAVSATEAPLTVLPEPIAIVPPEAEPPFVATKLKLPPAEDGPLTLTVPLAMSDIYTF